MSRAYGGARKPEPVRVLHHLGGLNRGGIETWLLNVLRKCDRKRVQMDFLVRSHEPGEYSAEISALGSRIMTCPSHRNPIAFVSKVERLLRGCPRYDVLHSHLAQYDGVAMWIAKRLGIPIRISHSHSDTRVVTQAASLPWRMYCAAGRMLIKRFATERIAASGKAAESLFGEVPSTSNQVKVVYCGVDLERFAGAHVPDPALRASLGIAPGSYVVGHVGRFEPVKNHHFMIDVAQSVLQERPNTHFLFVGSGALEMECKARVDALGLSGQITFLGSRPDTAHFLKGAMDLFLLPSWYEGLPLVLLEAQAAGLHSLVSDAVTREAVADQEAVKFLPLSLGTSGWASEIVAAADLTAGREEGPACSLKGTPFDVEVSTEILMNLYRA